MREWMMGRPAAAPVHAPPVTPLEKQVVVTSEGQPSTIEAAQANLIEARLMGTKNLFGLHKERTALEALMMELRK